MSRKDVPDVLVVDAAQQCHLAGYDVAVDELLAEWTGEPVKVCAAAIERAIARGFVDCGVSARTCWPTPEGLSLVYARRSRSERGQEA